MPVHICHKANLNIWTVLSAVHKSDLILRKVFARHAFSAARFSSAYYWPRYRMHLDQHSVIIKRKLFVYNALFLSLDQELS